MLNPVSTSLLLLLAAVVAGSGTHWLSPLQARKII
jgi:hypothetical protein